MPKFLAVNAPSKPVVSVLSVILFAQMTSACVTSSKRREARQPSDANFVTSSITPDKSSLRQTNHWAKKWKENSGDPATAINYARSLTATGSPNEAVSVLQQASISSPQNQSVIAEYGKALATNGQLKQAMHNLNRAQSLGQPDWRIYSAQGIVLDKLTQHVRAREYYKSALSLNPNQASVLNNIGLSYALEGKLAKAEGYLRRAAEVQGAKSKVKKNLALVLGLEGKFNQSAETSDEVLSRKDTTTNIAYLKRMMAQPKTWRKLTNKEKASRQPIPAPVKVTTLKKKVVEETPIMQVVPSPKKITTLQRKAAPTRSKQEKVKPVAQTAVKTSGFNARIKNALANTKKTASIAPLGLRTN